MALTCGFYNSVDGDRKYDATQFASLFDGVITDGVVAAVGDFFATTPGGGMVVNVGTGRAWFNRTWTYSDAKIPLTLDASDLLYDRIDAVVLEIDTSIAVRDNSIKVIKGTPAQEPQKPVLTNEGDVHQYALAYVRVKASSIEVGAGDVTINVGQADCPFVTSIVDTPELDVLFAQWDAQFTAWFENVQSQLEGDVAANLQRQIDLKANKVDIGDFETPAKKLGLTGDLSVGASLGVLATVGDLHVWRRTQQVGDKIPATYKLGPQESKSIYVAQPRQVSFSASVSVSDDGTISLVSPENITLTDNGGYISTLESSLRGKYATWDGLNGICFVPSSCSFSYASMFYTCSAVQMLIFVPAVPPGTYTDYPVSVNPNTYQTGSDAKPAGYTLGEVKSGKFVLSNKSNSGWQMSWNYSDDVSVTENGVVSLSNPASTGITGNMSSQAAQAAAELIKGKFVSCTGGQSDFQANTVYFIPSDAVVTSTESQVRINKYQTVTGYPAIPAGTTIEYLGKLGDKARIVMGSYVGTGRYGNGNPNILKFDSAPKAIVVKSNNGYYGGMTWTFGCKQGASFWSGSTAACLINWAKKAVSWSNSQGAEQQLNKSGEEYSYFFMY